MLRYKLEILIASLLVASVAALTLNYSCLRTIEIQPTADWNVMRSDDRSVGGKSIAKAKKDNGNFVLDFDTRKGHTTPFAVMTIKPAKKQRFDFSWVQEFRITARCILENSEDENFFYFQVRTFEDGVSKSSDQLSRKYNESVIQTSPEFSTVSVTRDQFSIPGWWAQHYSVPHKCRQPSFGKSESFDFTSIATGIKGKLEISKVTVIGQWVSQAVLSQALLTVWMISFLGVLFARIFHLRNDLKMQKQKEADLLRLNELLSIQSKELSDMVSADPLTGLLNRRGARDFVFEVNDAFKDKGINFSLIMFDIDRFKKINDTRGHLAGDQILCDLANIVRNRTRATDAVSRWGGEEFLIICPNTSDTEAKGLAESLRSAISISELDYTASFGICSSKGFNDFADVLESADMAMYYAKESGRNQVAIYTHSQEKAKFGTAPSITFQSRGSNLIVDTPHQPTQ